MNHICKRSQWEWIRQQLIVWEIVSICSNNIQGHLIKSKENYTFEHAWLNNMMTIGDSRSQHVNATQTISESPEEHSTTWNNKMIAILASKSLHVNATNIYLWKCSGKPDNHASKMMTIVASRSQHVNAANTFMEVQRKTAHIILKV